MLDTVIRSAHVVVGPEALRCRRQHDVQEMWSKDGMISKQAWATASAVVREANIQTDVKYEEIIDMSFVESVRASL